MGLPLRTLRRVLLLLLLIFGLPLFFGLAGPIRPVDNRQTDSGINVDFDPAVCARLPGDEKRVCDYGSLFNAAGRASQVDPRLLAAVAYAESGYHAAVINCVDASPDGALGLMQFIPSTARARGVDPCDASSAIFGGAKYLRDLYNELGPVAAGTPGAGAGSPSRPCSRPAPPTTLTAGAAYRWELAVAGYNAGGQGVRDASGIPRNCETEYYVPQVMAKWEQYKGLFPTTTGIGGCPVAAPSGSTDPIETDHDHITPATQAMANAVIGCFGRGGRPIGCYDERLADGGRYEHPRGRACDFMITGGGSAAEGPDRERGQAMAEWVMSHADELHLLYVIWYRRIWDPSMGNVPWDQWRPYSGASPHTDHVHVSVKLMAGDPSWAECPHDHCSGPAYGVPR